MSVYRPKRPIPARAPAGSYRPGTGGPLAPKRRSDSDVVVVSALTIAATLISLYDLLLLAVNV